MPLLTTAQHSAWQQHLARGEQRAQDAVHPILVSVTWPIAATDLLDRFAAVSRSDAFFWEQPDQHRALVGVGVANVITTTGVRHITDATEQWRALVRDALIVTPDNAPGPVLFGGFTFDPLATHTRLWRGFSDGSLVVPQWLWRVEGDRATMTLSQMVGTDAASPREHVAAVAAEPLLSAARGLSDAAWLDLVSQSIRHIHAGDYQKVVLAHAETVQHASPFDLTATLALLRADYPNAATFAVRRGARVFVGATPERLAWVHGRQMTTMALAGSARRGATAAEDAQIAARFAQNAKIHDEHTLVVASIVRDLAAHCVTVSADAVPRLLRLPNVQHLETPISGELLSGHSVLDVVAALHPTPAVGGFPRAEALAAIRAGEALDRGWYAGPLGWLDAAGDGEFVVALRSALVEGTTATLFAGCGIVGESDPVNELAESRLKLKVMRRALLVDE